MLCNITLITKMSNNGMKTSFWGPHAWKFLFSSIAGSYPIRVDPNNKDHMKKVSAFQSMFKSIEHTLPCSFCRESYGRFIKEIPISDFQHSRKEMMKWLYLIHDKVNVKLMNQERECFESEKTKLISRNVSGDQLKNALKKIKSETMKTKHSPPFEKVLAMYEKQRAGCSKKTKRCS